MLQVLTCSHPNAATVYNLLVDLVSSAEARSGDVAERAMLENDMCFRSRCTRQSTLPTALQLKCEKLVLCESSTAAQHAIHAPNVYGVYTEDGSKRYKRHTTHVRRCCAKEG